MHHPTTTQHYPVRYGLDCSSHHVEKISLLCLFANGSQIASHLVRIVALQSSLSGECKGRWCEGMTLHIYNLGVMAIESPRHHHYCDANHNGAMADQLEVTSRSHQKGQLHINYSRACFGRLWFCQGRQMAPIWES